MTTTITTASAYRDGFRTAINRKRFTEHAKNPIDSDDRIAAHYWNVGYRAGIFVLTKIDSRKRTWSARTAIMRVGWQAHSKGLPVSANPYQRGTAAFAYWRVGHFARDAAKRVARPDQRHWPHDYGNWTKAVA